MVQTIRGQKKTACPENSNLCIDESITSWEEAIPLGNRQTGCLIWGQPEELRFSLDRTDIWDKTLPFGTDSNEFCYKKLVELARQQDTADIRKIFDSPYNYPVPTKLPAGKLIFGFQEGLYVKSYLNILTAEAVITIGTKSGEHILRCCCHATEEVGMISVDTIPDFFTVKLQNPGFGKKADSDKTVYKEEKREISQGGLTQLKYEEAMFGEIKNEQGIDIKWFVQPVSDDFSYGITMAVKKYKDKTEIYYKINTSLEGENWRDKSVQKLKYCMRKGYNKLFISHSDWWQKYFEESSISLPDKNLENMWYRANYLFGSCSGKGYYPMPLQGVWTADNGMLPPWKGDYHHDLNTQMSYCHYLKANHLDAGVSFPDFLWNRKGEAEEFAGNFYETGGLCLPAVMTIDGKALGGWPMYSLSPTNQIWLCFSFEQYYTYTGDEDFLKERAYPYFAGTAKCILGLLTEGADGLFYLPISSSPEIHDDEAQSFVTPNSNYDLSLMIYLFRTLAKFAGELGSQDKEKWESILTRLPKLAVNEKKVLMLSPDESLKESHRHLSNAMAVHPLKLIEYKSDEEKEIIDATILDYEILGSGMWVGFSFAWMAELYAVQKNGEGAADRLNIFWDSFCAPNGFHLNGDYKKRGYSSFHYRPFTLEAVMCAADALQEMLFQMKDGEMELFPAVPESWKRETISFRRLRGEKGLLVSAVLERGRLVTLKLESGKKQKITIVNWKKLAGETNKESIMMELEEEKIYNIIN